MNTLEILFFVLLFIVFYTYVGYGILLWILVKIKQSFISFYDTDEPKQETCRNGNNTDLPEITLFITAYNEEQVVDGKMKNCQELDYPKEKLSIPYRESETGGADQTIWARCICFRECCIVPTAKRRCIYADVRQ